MAEMTEHDLKCLRLSNLMEKRGFDDFWEYIDGLEKGRIDRMIGCKVDYEEMQILKGEIRTIRKIKNYFKQAKQKAKEVK